jgi:hypothetical protein
LIFYGEALKSEFRGKVIEKLGSQVDLAKTLLDQLELDASAFEFSKNLLDPSTPEFAFYSSVGRCGIVKKDRGLTIYTPTGTVIFDSNPSAGKVDNEAVQEIKAMLQVIMNRAKKLPE